jgi:predicted nucleic acid-binding Zn ribbon protein
MNTKKDNDEILGVEEARELLEKNRQKIREEAAAFTQRVILAECSQKALGK